MGNCFGKSNKFIINQMKDEYYMKKVNMSIIGNYKPKPVFIGEDMKQLSSLNSMCDEKIHLEIGNNPTRLVISYVEEECERFKKGDTFHIYKITYKTLTKTDEITQFDIYNAIQDYIYINKHYPKKDDSIVAT
jgi:hypothetical protein